MTDCVFPAINCFRVVQMSRGGTDNKYIQILLMKSADQKGKTQTVVFTSVVR